MSAPKWWYYFLAACIAIATLAVVVSVFRPRWEYIAENTVFNPRTAERCVGYPDSPAKTRFICINVTKGTVRPIR